MSHNIEVTTDKSQLDVARIHDYICNRSYWGKGRTLRQVETTIEESICFGAYVDGEQVGFARVVTDKVSIAYILDIFVFEEHRGLGFSRKLIESMLAHNELQTVNWLLGTNDAHGLYEKYGFTSLENPQRIMRKAAR